MPYRRPGSATAAGVLAIIYGSAFSLCGLWGLFALAAQGMGGNFLVGDNPQQAQLQKAMMDAMERDVPAYQVYQIGSTLIGLTCAILMFVAGIGILYLRPWARLLAIADSLVLIALALFQAIYQLAFVMPAMSRAFDAFLQAAVAQQQAGAQQADLIRTMHTIMNAATIGAAIVYIIMIVYFFIILALLSRRHVRAAFANPLADIYEEPPPSDKDYRRSDYDDDEDDGYDRGSERDEWRSR